VVPPAVAGLGEAVPVMASMGPLADVIVVGSLDSAVSSSPVTVATFVTLDGAFVATLTVTEIVG